MATARASLKGFLATAKKALLAPASQRPNPLTFVVGNQSAGQSSSPAPLLQPTDNRVDLDSLCSALLLAYFRTHTPPHTLHIPLSNLPRADLALSPELNAVLNPAGLKSDDLITLSDLPREGLEPQATRWLLVDHNVLTGDLAARFSKQVIGCIDHHEDEGVIPRDLPEGQPRVFAKCGSCMSLVLDQSKSTWDRLSSLPCEDGTPAAECDAHLARVTLAPILVDTTRLTTKSRTTDWDIRAVELAESKLLPSSSQTQSQTRTQTGTETEAQPDPARYDREAYHATLTRLSSQLQGLSYRDVLRKDYKRWTEGALALGMSTVAQGLGYALAEVGGRSRDSFLAALRDWAREQGLQVAAVMTLSRPGGVFTRELLVWGFGAEGVEVVREFRRRFGEALGLETWEGGELDGGGEGEGEWRICWRQRAVDNSRKQVAPMLREAMRESARL